MVHYFNASARFAAQSPPPLCPKCGNHRTEIVGRSPDEKTIIIRCAACGERSELPADTDALVSNR